MPQVLTIDGCPVPAITETTYQHAARLLPRVPLEPGILWIGETCWVATYTQERMWPEDFESWDCLNEVLL